jgi:ATP-dependent RNA helicase RhlE
MPPNIQKLSKQILDRPTKVEVAPVSSTAETIQQYLYYTDKQSKKGLLMHILKDSKLDQVLLFSRTKHGADKIVRSLKAKNIEAAAIHGNKSQVQRQKALKAFKHNDVRVLVATDIAARGIDINELKYVINYDIPNISETYVHRIGRTGRAGKEGVAISMCEPEENADIRSIEKLINLKIEVIKEHPFPQTTKPMTAQEKKEFNKEKQRKKQEFFANRRKNKSAGNQRGGANNKRKSDRRKKR